jgi:hypothetical protein
VVIIEETSVPTPEPTSSPETLAPTVSIQSLDILDSFDSVS